MNELQQKINEDLRSAFKRGEGAKVGVLRLLQAAIQNGEIEKHKKEEGLSDGEIIEAIQREVKRRREAAELYRKGNREDLVLKEETEAALLEVYLPKQLTQDELRAIITETVNTAGKLNLGLAIGAVMTKVKGRADGAAVRKMVEEMLKIPNV